MSIVALRLAVSLALCVAAGWPEPAGAEGPRVRLSIVQTAQRPAIEGTLFAGGRMGTRVAVGFSAVLIQHGSDRLLVDTGLGRRIDAQWQADMAWWQRPFFGYDAPVRPARDQLDAAGEPAVTRILLTHAHWDHASGLVDFPEATVLLGTEEHAALQGAPRGAGSPWPSQVGDPAIRWQPLALEARPVEGFERSLDLYGDGSVVVVGLPGHTPGSLGVLVRTSGGRRVFLVGDTVWNAGALVEGAPKFAPARWLVDRDAHAVARAIERLRAAQARDPALVVLPAHDAAVQATLAIYPAWVD